MALHRRAEVAQIAEIAQVAEIAKVPEVRLMRVVPDLMQTDQLIRERGGVLIAGGTGRYPGRGRCRRRLLRRVERFVEVRPGCWMMAGRVMQVVQRVQRMLHGGDRVYRDR